MPRPKGSRDRAFEERRRALIGLARMHLSSPLGRKASWRDIAAACNVSVSTMNHYFSDRSSLVAAILEQAAHEGAPFLALASKPSGPFPQSIEDLVSKLSLGFSHGVLALQVIGLGEGFADPRVGCAYLGDHLEPVLGAIAKRLSQHVALGEMRNVDTHFAAIQLLSPLLIIHLHQTVLGGDQHFPKVIDDFCAEHAAAFVRASRAA